MHVLLAPVALISIPTWGVIRSNEGAPGKDPHAFLSAAKWHDRLAFPAAITPVQRAVATNACAAPSFALITTFLVDFTSIPGLGRCSRE